MALNLGTVRPGTTIYIYFDTFAGSTGASITMSGLAVGDILIYKDGGTTQRASTTGYTLLDTDGIDFDALTGIHGFSVDLSSDATAGFFQAGSQYTIVVSTITVDAQTVSFVAAFFRIGYENAIANTTIATLASQTSFTLTAGPAEDDALNGCTILVHDLASAVQVGKAIINDYTGSTKTVTLVAGVTFTAAAGDNVAVLLPSLQPTVWGRTADVSAGGELGLDWANVGSPTSALALTGTTIATTQKVDVETIKTNPVVNGGTATFPTNATLASTTNITAGTITTVTNLTNAPTAGDLTTTMKTSVTTASDAVAIKADTAAILVDTGTTLDGRLPAALTANGNMKSSLMEIIATALTETSGQLAAAFKKFFDKATPTGTINSIPDAVAGATGGLFIAGTNAATTVTTALTTTFTGNLTGSVGSVTGSVGSVTGLTASNLDTTVSSRASQTSVDTIDDFLDTEIAAIVTATGAAAIRTAVGLASANLDTQLDALPTNAELATSQAAADDATLAAIAALNNLSAAQVNTEVLDVLSVDIIPDSVATDGTRPTVFQALLMIARFLFEASVSSTTVTVKKEDGSTTSMTFTTNSATTPTSITRSS